MLIGENMRDNHACIGIDGQMQFTLGAARLGAMFFFQPLYCAKDLQTCAVNEHMQRSLWCGW